MTGQLLEESISFLKKRQLIKQLVAAKNPSPTRFDCKRQLSVLDSKRYSSRVVEKCIFI